MTLIIETWPQHTDLPLADAEPTAGFGPAVVASHRETTFQFTDIQPEPVMPEALSIQAINGISRALGRNLDAVAKRFGVDGALVADLYANGGRAAMLHNLGEVSDADMLSHMLYLAAREPSYQYPEPHIPVRRPSIVRFALECEAAWEAADSKTAQQQASLDVARRAAELGTEEREEGYEPYTVLTEAAELLHSLFSKEPPAALPVVAMGKHAADVVLSYARTPGSRHPAQGLGGSAARFARQ